jgi:hypothetical protein
MDETAEQIQQILDLLPEEWNTAHWNSIMLWLEGEYLSDADSSWRALTRYEQADWYILWIREERGLI